MTNEGILDIGLLVTAIFATIGYLYRTGVARRAAAKTLLFHLLEIRHELVIESPQLDKLIDEFRKEMRELVGDRPLLRSLVIDAVPREKLAIMLTAANQNLVRADQGLLESYEKALFNYSQVDPILTHKIRGMKLLPKLSKNFSDVKASFETMMDEFENVEALKRHGKKKMEGTLQNTLNELISRLEDHIRELSCKAGIDTWVTTRKALKVEPTTDEDSEMTKGEIAEMMETLFKTALLSSEGLSESQRESVKAASLEDIMALFESKLSEAEERPREEEIT